MAKVIVKVDGATSVRNNMGIILKNIQRFAVRFPIKTGRKIREQIRQTIEQGSYQRHGRYGPYRRATGKGMGDSLRVWTQTKGRAIIDVDPAAEANGASPSEYSDYVERGTKKARAMRYFEKGVKRYAASQLSSDIEQASKKIVGK